MNEGPGEIAATAVPIDGELRDHSPNLMHAPGRSLG